jgi:molybdopterin synthase sulfur carrier subunit
MATIRVELPLHLRRLASITGHEAIIDVEPPATITRVLHALEARYPMLEGTIRDHVTRERRAFLRFFVCEEDWSHNRNDDPLPSPILAGKEPLIILGAIAGG